MSRIGLTPDELLLATWSAPTPRRYAACLPGLNVLAGETLALVGDGADLLLDELAHALAPCTWVDGGVAAAGGALRIHAQQAARVGVAALAVTDPFGVVTPAARALAIADLAGLSSLGLTSAVIVPDPETGALFADRVVAVAEGHPFVAYPVVAPLPRRRADVAAVTARLQVRLAG